MKKETAEAKLNALFGLTEVAKEVKTKATGNVMGITEEEIQTFREMQGLTYFLQAPALFQEKTCKHCGEQFLVSRLYVAYCSYTCIRKSLNELGLDWRKGYDIEGLVDDPQVWAGNEPLWIRKPSLLKAQEVLNHMLTTEDTTSESKEPVSSTAQPLNPVQSSSQTTTESVPSSLDNSAITPSKPSEPGLNISNKKGGGRKIIFNT